MPYDPALADRLRELLGPEAGSDEKHMFGDIKFSLGGHMAVCASTQGDLIVRVGADEFGKLLSRAGVRALEMRGRPLTGWIRVDLSQLRTRKQLQTWVDRGVACARGLPPKT